jgi:predicted Zn-dependent protease
MPIGPDLRPKTPLAVLTWPVRHAVGWVRGAPLWIKAALAGVVLLGGTVGVGYGSKRLAAGRKHRAALAGWREFSEASRTGDQAGMTAALDGILVADPAEPTALARRHALVTNEAAASDPAMASFTMRQCLSRGDMPAAAREADKLLRERPKNWLAHCARAANYLRAGDRDAARAELDALPEPTDPDAATDPGGLAVAFQLFARLDRDPDPLRAFVQNRLCPTLKSPRVQSAAAGEKLALLTCYLQGFEPARDRPQPAALLVAWSPANLLAESAAEDALAGPDAALLARVGALGNGLRAALAALRAGGQVTAEQATNFARENDTRTRKCLTKLKELDPDAAGAYHGLAQLYAEAGDYAAAREEVVAGLRRCESDPALSALFGRMLQAEGRALEAYGVLRAKARAEPDRAAWWSLAVEAALAANRRDLALADCAAMREALPGNPWPARVEASIRLRGGDAAAALLLLLLTPLGPDALARDPEAARLYARALAEGGRREDVLGFLAAAVASSQTADDPAAAAGALRGLVEANATAPVAAAAERVAADCQRLLGRWPESDELYRLRAEALFQAAAATAPAWEPAKLAEAMRAAQRYRARQPLDRTAAARLVTLRLHSAGDRSAVGDAALRDAVPLRDAEADPLLGGPELDALGAAYLAAGRFADARRVLTRLAASGAATAGSLTRLALALNALGEGGAARAALASAQSRPRTPQEQADYVAAARTIYPESP